MKLELMLKLFSFNEVDKDISAGVRRDSPLYYKRKISSGYSFKEMFSAFLRRTVFFWYKMY